MQNIAAVLNVDCTAVAVSVGLVFFNAYLHSIDPILVATPVDIEIVK
jgi:hypothetical protein